MNLFVKNAVRLIALAMAVAVVLPLFILLLYDENLPITIHTDITADGLLGYVGSMLICLSSLVLSSIAIYQNTENKEKTEKEQIESFYIYILNKLVILICFDYSWIISVAMSH